MSAFQVMPPLPVEEYAALRDDIAERGIVVPLGGEVAVTDLRSRADAAHRLPALPGRWGRSLAARDPLLPWPTVRQPSTFSLTATELRHEAQRLLESGWAVHEVLQVLATPEACAA